MSSSLLEILTLMEQVIIAQEAESDKVMKKVGFSETESETEQEVDFSRFQIDKNSTYPWNISSPTSSFDQGDLDKFVNRFTEDTSLSKGFYDDINRTTIDTRINSFKKMLEPLIQIRPFLPEEVQNNYNKQLIASIDRIRKYWLNPEDRIAKKQDKETLRLIGMLIIKNASAVMQKFDDLRSLSDDFTRDYTEFIKSSEEEMQAGASSITRPQVQTTRLPKNLQDYSALMNTFFEGANDLNSRVGKLKQLADFFASEDLQAEASKMSNTKFMSYVVMMDYLVEIAKSFDAQSGRYLLEYLLAVVSMGEVSGATLGSTGQQDAVDFVDEKDNLGSSKFVSSYKDVYQSIAGFSDYKGEPITYVVALKEGSPMRLTTVAPEPVEVQSLKVHIFNVTYKGEDRRFIAKKVKNKTIRKKADVYVFEISSIEEDLLIEKSEKSIDIGAIAQEAPSFTIPLAFTTEKGTKTYRQMMSTSLGETKQQLLAIVKDLFDGLKKADEMSRKYVVTGKPDDGGKAINGMRQANEKLLALSKSKKDDKTSLFDDEYQPPDINAEN